MVQKLLSTEQIVLLLQINLTVNPSVNQHTIKKMLKEKMEEETSVDDMGEAAGVHKIKKKTKKTEETSMEEETGKAAKKGMIPSSDNVVDHFT